MFGIGDLFHRHPLRELIPLLSIELPCEVASRTVPGQLKPHSLHVVLIDSGTVRQHLTEATLAWRITLLSRPTVPRRSFGIITDHAAVPEVQQT